MSDSEPGIPSWIKIEKKMYSSDTDVPNSHNGRRVEVNRQLSWKRDPRLSQFPMHKILVLSTFKEINKIFAPYDDIINFSTFRNIKN
ncbi:hypothetical protein BB561_005710 [Smittium simulii]|uniref:Uncharacterized protein n=1 Tax=Smittium simulii TaxID=133385 RepID=A0A2T9Y8U4_9FUNG|nr:hypothetical protein BB561_005710 [Smittium simulii]